MKIEKNHRTFIAGRTGGGKSYLAKELTADMRNLIVYDEKEEIEIPRSKIIRTVGELKNETSGRLIFRPSIDSIRSKKARAKLLDEFFRIIYLAQNRVVWIDEIYAVADNANNIPHYLRAIITRGRSKNIGLVALTQRPSHIPLFFMSEAEHYFIFPLQIKKDRERIMEYIGDVKFGDLSVKKHEFFYYDVLAGGAVVKDRI